MAELTVIPLRAVFYRLPRIGASDCGWAPALARQELRQDTAWWQFYPPFISRIGSDALIPQAAGDVRAPYLSLAWLLHARPEPIRVDAGR